MLYAIAAFKHEQLQFCDELKMELNIVCLCLHIVLLAFQWKEGH